MKTHLLLSILQNYLTNPRVTQQIHSHLVTTASLHNSLLLFNSLLRCYSLNDTPKNAFLLYKQPLKPPAFDSFTYAFLVKASANLSNPVMGIQVHALSTKAGFDSHVYVQTALVNMYMTCGFLLSGYKVFDKMTVRNLVSWNVLITGLVKWGKLELAISLFEEMPIRTVVSWTGIIDGYTRVNRYREALGLFRKMVVCDLIEPTTLTILAIMPAIANIGEVTLCELVHGYAEKMGFNEGEIRVSNSILDTYAKCGCISDALRFFEDLSSKRRNLVTWTSMITAFAMHGMGIEAVEHFERMVKAGSEPSHISFLSVLNACSHGGLVEEGLGFFDKMMKKSEIAPSIKHYGCLVDMLGRAGRLEEAEKIALDIPSEIANDVIWRTLLGACSFHGNVEMAERVTSKIMEIERGCGGDYVLMYNIFQGVGRYDDAESFRNLMDERSAFKLPGRSAV
ncbi:hypothetical protein ACFE04_022054 [Oxalis oulophora]